MNARLLRPLALILLLLPLAAHAQSALPALTSTPGPGGSQTYTLSIQTLLTLTALTFIPAALLMMTSFTRIVIVLSLLRHALGTQTSPPNQVLVGMSLFLTFFVMGPTLDKVYQDAYLPYTQNTISFEQAVERAEAPMRASTSGSVAAAISMVSASASASPAGISQPSCPGRTSSGIPAI